MATYFNQSHEIQPESIQTLYLMNPNLTSYSDASPPQTSMVYLNNPSFNPVCTLSQPQHLVGIPIQRPPSSIHHNLNPTQHRLSLRPPMPEDAKVSGLINSKYLKLAQQLLDEVASVSKGIKDGSYMMKRMYSTLNGEDANEKGSAELTILERQEIQMRKAKLVNMLDEVIQRYKQYHQQMQHVVSSFEAVAGVGSAKSYTSLALQTISQQFRCLRDAITGQIQASVKNLGEDDFNGGTGSKGSMLQFVDQQVRQQRALQQLGMIHNNAWRPQRGLPERSVLVLRAWLFEHFLHPYPKDSDKKMLANQSGLTRSQVSNWFINARVRLWKPMVEEMYKEEMKGQEPSNIDERTSETDVNEDSSSKSNTHQDNSPKTTDQIYTQPPIMMSNYDEDENLFVQSKPKKAWNDDESMNRENETHDYSFITGSTNIYSVGELERFGIEQFGPRVTGNGISLTLGLTNYNSLSLSGEGQAYLSNENNGFTSLNSNQSVVHPSNRYENISIESRKRFASQLLQDFVA